MRLSRDAVTLGRVAGGTPVHVVVALDWRNRAALDRLIRELHDPRSPQYQRFLSPRVFQRRFAPRLSQLGALNRFLRRAGLQVTAVSASRVRVTAVGSARRVERALDTELLEVLDRGRRHTVTARRPSLPAELGAHVIAVGAGLALQTPGGEGRGPINLPLGPADVAKVYGFDGAYGAGLSGAPTRAASIAIATAFPFEMGDLQQFWRDTGIQRDPGSVELIPVVGKTTVADPDGLETTLDVQWATVMAPRSPVLVYAATDSAASSFLAVYDRIVAENRAAVITTSWGRCEADYPSDLLDQFDAVFARAAAQGITIVAAAGDDGGFECAADAEPSVGFPASHPYVVAVGGTSLQPAGGAVGEVAWSGSGGGVSRLFAAPPWQMTSDTGRAVADVALHADPSAGYRIVYRGVGRTVGGTSVGAPIWAAVIALANQGRSTVARPPVGMAAPAFCEVALAGDLPAGPGFLDIVDGHNGAFPAARGYDYPTGWGVPRVAALITALTRWTPPTNAQGGLGTLLDLQPTSPAVEGAARLRFQQRCMATDVHFQARRLGAGTYTLELDGVPAASFSPDRRGCAMVTVPGLDIRGHVVSLRAPGGQVLFTSAAESRPPVSPTPGPVRAPLLTTGMVPRAEGSVEYLVTGSRHELTVRAAALGDGRYDVRFGSEVIGTLAIRNGSGTVRFDSEGISGMPLSTVSLCQPVIVARGSTVYLRSATDALTPGGCGRSR